MKSTALSLCSEGIKRSPRGLNAECMSSLKRTPRGIEHRGPAQRRPGNATGLAGVYGRLVDREDLHPEPLGPHLNFRILQPHSAPLRQRPLGREPRLPEQAPEQDLPETHAEAPENEAARHASRPQRDLVLQLQWIFSSSSLDTATPAPPRRGWAVVPQSAWRAAPQTRLPGARQPFIEAQPRKTRAPGSPLRTTIRLAPARSPRCESPSTPSAKACVRRLSSAHAPGKDPPWATARKKRSHAHERSSKPTPHLDHADEPESSESIPVPRTATALEAQRRLHGRHEGYVFTDRGRPMRTPSTFP